MKEKKQEEFMNDEEMIMNNVKKDEKDEMNVSQKEKMIHLMDRYHSSEGSEKAAVIEEILNEVQGFLGLAITKYFPAFKAECYDDLYQECVVAFLENIDKYDPTKSTITTFLTYPLIHAMCTYTNSITNKCSSYYSGIMNRVRKAMREFEKEGHTPSVSDIALKTNLSVSKVENALRRITASDEVRYDTEADLDAMISEYMKTPEDQILDNEVHHTLELAFKNLPEKDMKLIIIAFGLDDGIQKSTNQVAKIAGVSVNEASKSISRSLRLLADDENLMHLFGKSRSRKKRESLDQSLSISMVPNDNIMELFDNLDEEDNTDNKTVNMPALDTEYDGTFVINF